MNNGIKNKLKTLIGKEIDYHPVESGQIFITYPSFHPTSSSKVLRIEDEDCVVLLRGDMETYLSIDHITYLNIKKKVVI